MKSLKFPKTFRLTEESIEILEATAYRVGQESYTALLEDAIIHYCAYLNHITKKKEPQ
jgi:hypothetical protein